MNGVNARPEPPDRRVGDYQLLTMIGEGGMGVVHLAQAPDGRRVALKVLRPHIVGDKEARDRLAREVGSLSRISSPRVAEILDADPHGPIPFVATRYVPGLSLHDHVREEGPITGADLDWFAHCLAEALGSVHGVGVLHRDIKPSNVLMEGRSPVLIDFGLARLAEDPRLTATGWLLGTPGYIAPELLYGDEATTASDVHAWAATVVFAATGRSPYGRGPAMAIMDRVRRGEHDLRDVPTHLTGLLATALAPEPLQRPTLEELRADLGRRVGSSGQPGRSRVHRRAPSVMTTPIAVAHAGRAADVTTPVDAGAVDPEPPTIPTRVQSVPAVVPTPIAEAPPERRPVTAVLPPHDERPALEPYDDRPSPDAPFVIQPTPGLQPRRGWQRVGLIGIAAFFAGLVALAPYLGAAIVLALVAALRLVSVTRERHRRRRQLRGRPRWYDVPTTTLASPAYLVMSLVGTLLLVLWSVAVALATGVFAALLQLPLPAGMTLVGAAFVASQWWGPGAGRVREVCWSMTRPLAGRSSRAWLVLGLGVVGAAALIGTMAASGVQWSPEQSAPWSDGFAAQLARMF